MIRRVAVGLVAVGIAAAMTIGHQVGLKAALTPAGAACKLTGTATLTPGVTIKAAAVSYTFTGNLANCQSSDKTLKSGVVTASGAGKLSCGSGTSAGTANVAWNNGQSSTISFKTTSAGSATTISGKTTGGEFNGDTNAGAITFTTTKPQACLKAPGLTTLGFTGATGAGQP